jgi:RNA polymerase sigma factor (sigma-70 family)
MGMSAIALAPAAAQTGADVEDSELVRRLRRGDERAFELLYQRYHRRITAYIQGMVHDHARAEDIAQDVFVSSLRRIRETDRPIAFKPWIYEIAKNACIDQFRRSRRAEEVSYDADEGLGAADYGRLVSTSAMPEARLESKQQLDHLRGAFGGLSEAHHEILVMRELEGLSYREIGERLGMSRPSVESTLFRARRRLTEEYEELVSGARCQRIQSIIGTAAAGEVGLRDQRRLARHVSHCQPCRRQARIAGLDIPVTADRPMRQRIAAMLPLPLFLRRRWLGDSSQASSTQDIASAHISQFAQLSALGSTVDPSWVKAAAAAATIAVAGAGAGFAVSHKVISGLGPLSPVGNSRSAVHDERAASAAHTTKVSFGKGFSSATSAPTRTVATAPAKATAPAQKSAGGTSTPASSPATAPAESADVNQVASGLPSGSGAGAGTPNIVPSSPPSAPTLPVNPSAPQLQLPNSTPKVTVPDVSGTVQGATGTATGTVTNGAGTAQGTLSGALGGG